MTWISKLCGTRRRRHRISARPETAGVSHKIMAEAIDRARRTRARRFSTSWPSVIDKPRADLSKYAPRIETIKINPEKIGALIGPGGKTIKGIVAETGAEINIEDDGSVHIYATSRREHGAREGNHRRHDAARSRSARPIRVASSRSKNSARSSKFSRARTASSTFPSWPTSASSAPKTSPKLAK